MTPEQEKQVEEIRALNYYAGSPVGKLITIVDDLRKQLNAAVLLGQAAASLNKPMTDAEFMGAIKE